LRSGSSKSVVFLVSVLVNSFVIGFFYRLSIQTSQGKTTANLNVYGGITSNAETFKERETRIIFAVSARFKDANETGHVASVKQRYALR
jgi:hypothetical protein